MAERTTYYEITSPGAYGDAPPILELETYWYWEPTVSDPMSTMTISKLSANSTIPGEISLDWGARIWEPTI